MAPASRTDSAPLHIDQVQEFRDDQGRDAGLTAESATLPDLAADEDPSTREEAQALMQALATNPDGSE